MDVGQPVGHAPRGLSADIFSGVSGTVKAIQPVFYSTGKTDTTVIIESDGCPDRRGHGGTPRGDRPGCRSSRQ
ncbi:MAG: hypothetical protein ACLSVD_05055 [Eggerthellaceae bacterium]